MVINKVDLILDKILDVTKDKETGIAQLSYFKLSLKLQYFSYLMRRANSEPVA